MPSTPAPAPPKQQPQLQLQLRRQHQRKSPPPPLRHLPMKQLAELVRRGDTANLRATLSAWNCRHHPHHRLDHDRPKGFLALRGAALMAAHLGKMGPLRFLVEEKGVAPHWTTEDQRAILEAAPSAYTGCAEVTPLFAALQNRQEDAALYLLEKGLPTVDFLHRDASGDTVLLLAATAGMSLTFVKKLLLLAEVTGCPRPIPTAAALEDNNNKDSGSKSSSSPPPPTSGAQLLLEAADARGHRALCRCLVHGRLDILDHLLGLYHAQGRLAEALERPCQALRGGPPLCLAYHAMNPDPGSSTTNSSGSSTGGGHRGRGCYFEGLRHLIRTIPPIVLDLGRSREVGAVQLVTGEGRSVPCALSAHHMAAALCDVRALRLLLAPTADEEDDEAYVAPPSGFAAPPHPSVDDRTPHTGFTPLHCACASLIKRTPRSEKALLQTVALLIDLGADALARDCEGYTPLDVARARGHRAVCEYLVGVLTRGRREVEAKAAEAELLRMLDGSGSKQKQPSGSSGSGGGKKTKKDKKKEKKKKRKQQQQQEEQQEKAFETDKVQDLAEEEEEEGETISTKAKPAASPTGRDPCAFHKHQLQEKEKEGEEEDKEDEEAAYIRLYAPEEFLCGLSGRLMRDAVLCEDGYSYERAALAAWFAACGAAGWPLTSPRTLAPVGPTVVRNITLLRMIGDFVDEKRAEFAAVAWA